MTASNRKRTAGQRDPDMLLYAIAAGAIAVLVLAYLSWRAGRWVSGSSGDAPLNPVAAAIDIARGELAWPVAATVIFVVALVAIVVAAAAVARRRNHGAALRDFDAAASAMGRASELAGIRERDARASARRLRGRDAIAHPLHYGLLLGRLVNGPRLYMLWEWVGLVIGGPRSGKTTAYAIPMICQAPGPVFATSNKADILQATRWVRDVNDIPDTTTTATGEVFSTGPVALVRGARAALRRRAEPPRARGNIWISDLQHIAGDDGQQWWWDPFWRVHTLADARELAAIFAGAETQESARVDAYFDGGAKELLALHTLAAAVAGGDLKHVDGWLTAPKLEVARELLRRHGHPDAAARVEMTAALNPRQQDGLFDMARRFINVMTVPEYARSVLPPNRVRFDGDNTMSTQDLRHNLPQFDPQKFVTSTDTMYALSMEGAGAATSLTTALADTIFQAGVVHARRSGGRLPVPMLAVLDEAANVCKLPDLPDWYSHFGGQGIVIVTMLQSLAQASKVWSRDKLDMLVDSSNAYIYAGSSNNEQWLAGMSRLIGSRDIRRTSRSSSSGSRGSSSTSDSWSSEPILSVDDLKALPFERAILSSSGNRTVATAKNFWWDTPYAELIEASKAACSNSGDRTHKTVVDTSAATPLERKP